jgi:hypothetical protein
VNEINFQRFVIKEKYQFENWNENFREYNEKLIANKDEDMNDNRMIEEEILNKREVFPIDV